MQERPEEREEAKDREYVIHLHLPRLPGLLPEETRSHMKAARREMLRALRGMIDAAIASTEPKPEEKGPTKIEVE